MDFFDARSYSSTNHISPDTDRKLAMSKLIARLRNFATALLALLALSLPAHGNSDTPVLDRVVGKGVLRVAMSADQPPFNMRNRSGKIVGFDVDLSQTLARAMQVELEIVELPFAQLLPALIDGKADIAISGITITPDRSRRVSFVGPYILSGKSMLTTARIKNVVKSSADFNDPEIRIVALKDSTSESFVQRGLPKASLYGIANYNEGIQMLLTGSMDAMVADINILKLAMLRYPDAGLGIIEPQLSIEPLGIAIPKGDSQFENLMRNYLHAFDRGKVIEALRNKWFEDNSWIATLP